MSTIAKYPISALPLPPRSKLLIHNLTPDTATPSAAEFADVLRSKPSVQRRPRLIAPESHFSHVSPFPLPFPYEIEPPSNSDPVENKEEYIEQWLSAREALHDKVPCARSDVNPPLKKLYPENRDQPMELLGLSESGLRDCLPHLDVGDAFEVLGTPSLAGADEAESEKRTEMTEDVAARQEIMDVLGGHALLTSDAGADIPFAPWSLRYSGHQFGTWAGQLGDGRAITVRE